MCLTVVIKWDRDKKDDDDDDDDGDDGDGEMMMDSHIPHIVGTQSNDNNNTCSHTHTQARIKNMSSNQPRPTSGRT